MTQASFRSGVVVGLITLVVGVVAALAWRSRSRDPLPAAGLWIAAAGVLALLRVGEPEPGLAAAVLVLGGVGLVVDVVPRARPFLPLLALPGAWILATRVEVGQTWAPLAIGATIVVGGALVADFDGRPGTRTLGPAMMVVSLAGVFVTVPETEQALPVLGATLPLVLLGWPTCLATLGAGGSLAATGLLAWTVGQGGTFRDSAIVGGLACLGILVAEPVGRALLRRRLTRAPIPPWAMLAILATHVLAVLIAARVVGLRDDMQPAVALAALALALAVGVTVAIIFIGEARTGRPLLPEHDPGPAPRPRR